MGFGGNDPWVDSHISPNRYGVKSSITIIAKVCDPESRRDLWFKTHLVQFLRPYFHPQSQFLEISELKISRESFSEASILAKIQFTRLHFVKEFSSLGSQIRQWSIHKPLCSTLRITHLQGWRFWFFFKKSKKSDLFDLNQIFFYLNLFFFIFFLPNYPTPQKSTKVVQYNA